MSDSAQYGGHGTITPHQDDGAGGNWFKRKYHSLVGKKHRLHKPRPAKSCSEQDGGQGPSSPHQDDGAGGNWVKSKYHSLLHKSRRVEPYSEQDEGQGPSSPHQDVGAGGDNCLNMKSHSQVREEHPVHKPRPDEGFLEQDEGQGPSTPHQDVGVGGDNCLNMKSHSQVREDHPVHKPRPDEGFLEQDEGQGPSTPQPDVGVGGDNCLNMKSHSQVREDHPVHKPRPDEGFLEQNGGHETSNPDQLPGKYSTRTGAANQDGTNFEIKMCALVFLRAVQSYNSFTMTSNDPRAGGFDDIVLSYGSPGNEQSVLVQLKTSSKPLNLRSPRKKSLKYYFQSLEKTNMSANFKNYKYVFYTNADMKLNPSAADVDSPAKRLLCTTWKPHNIFQVDLDDDICKDIRDDIGAEDFVNRLLIFRNQCGPKYLDELIKQELIKMSNGFVPECRAIQKNFVEKITTWWQEPEKTALDENWGEWTELKAQLIGQNTLLKQIKFCEDALSDLKQRVLDSKSDIILFKCDSAEAQIASSKVYQTFIRREALQVLFTDLSEPQSSQNMLFDLWSTYEWDLLVVTDVTNCTEKLGDNITNYTGNPAIQSKKKIVIVSSGDAVKLGPLKVHEFSTDVIKSTFKQLDENSQHRLRNLEVDFQGKRIALGKIMTHNILEGGVLQYVVTSPKIEIGAALPACNGKYIPRTLSKRIPVGKKFVFTNPHEDIFIGSADRLTVNDMLGSWLRFPSEPYETFASLHLTFTKDIMSRRELYETISGFKCCAGIIPERPEHFLEEQYETFYWIHSHGSTDRIQRNVGWPAVKDESIEMFIRDAKTPLVKEDDLVRKEIQTVIVADEPGSGKTTLLLEVANKMKELNLHRWVIHIDLNKHSGILREIKKAVEVTLENVCQLLIKAGNLIKFAKEYLRDYVNESRDICNLFKAFPKIAPPYKDTILREMKQGVKVLRENVLHLLIKAANLDDSELGKRLLKYSVFESGDICILFDAFDEIAPSYSDTVLDILNVISRKFKVSNLWIASRYNMRKKLEYKLKSCVFRIEPLSDEEQIEFMSMFWEKEEAKEFHSAIIKKLPLGMTSSPLHINMICEIFSDLDMSDKFSRISASFDVVKLYEQFIEKKFDIYIKEKSNLNSASAAIEDIKEKERESFMERHMLCSLDVLRLDIWAKESSIRDKVRKFRENIEEGKERLGIIDGVVAGAPHFIHRTFAEFFAAKWLAENWKNNREMLDWVSTEVEFQFVNKLFCLELDRELPVHLAVLNEDIDALKKLKKEDLNKTDVLGRTPLHIAAMMKGGNALNVVSDVLQYDPDLEIDDVLGHTPLYYADSLGNKDVERILRERVAL